MGQFGELVFVTDAPLSRMLKCRSSMFTFTVPCASVVLLIALWWLGELNRPLLIAACVLICIAAEILAPTYSTVWFAAMLLNVSLAIYMAIRLKLN